MDLPCTNPDPAATLSLTAGDQVIVTCGSLILDVRAGPVEATALGNVAIQMVAAGAVASLDDARSIIERSFPLEAFEPSASDQWEPHYRRVQEYVELTCA